MLWCDGSSAAVLVLFQTGVAAMVQVSDEQSRCVVMVVRSLLLRGGAEGFNGCCCAEDDGEKMKVLCMKCGGRRNSRWRLSRLPW